ncbi:MAG TPA: hypothetical protein VMT69_02880 [Kineosporiaceae bacterium]|nr:hypothetical protein [Kineosporiaceae bacterium]
MTALVSLDAEVPGALGRRSRRPARDADGEPALDHLAMIVGTDG